MKILPLHILTICTGVSFADRYLEVTGFCYKCHPDCHRL